MRARVLGLVTARVLVLVFVSLLWVLLWLIMVDLVCGFVLSCSVVHCCICFVRRGWVAVVLGLVCCFLVVDLGFDLSFPVLAGVS